MTFHPSSFPVFVWALVYLNARLVNLEIHLIGPRRALPKSFLINVFEFPHMHVDIFVIYLFICQIKILPILLLSVNSVTVGSSCLNAIKSLSLIEMSCAQV